MFGSVGKFVGNLITNHQTMSHQDFWNRQNIALQKEFAQNSLKWRVEDAKRAGVHPMAALGITPASFSPVNSSINMTDLGVGLGEMGQNIDRAIQIGKDKDAQLQAEDFNNKLNNLNLEKVGLENDLLRAQIASMNATRLTAAPPAAPPVDPRAVSPLGGGLDGKLVSPEPMKVTPTKQVGVEPSAIPSVGHIIDSSGKVTPVQSSDAKERLEEDFVGSLVWLLNNRIVPHLKTMFGFPAGIHEPPRDMLPQGAVRWSYDGLGSWTPVDAHGNDMTLSKKDIRNKINRRFR